MSLELRTMWYLYQLRKNQWLPTKQLKKKQEGLLRATIKHAYNNVEFYHKKFNSMGIKPESIKSVEDLSKLPITTRADIQSNFPNGIIAKGTNLNKCIQRRTSGSTGTPLEIVFDRNDEAFRTAVYLRAMIECGLSIRDKVATVNLGYEGSSNKWFQRLGFLRRTTISPPVPLEQGLQTLRSFRPDVLYAYASYLLIWAKMIKERGIKDVHQG